MTDTNQKRRFEDQRSARPLHWEEHPVPTDYLAIAERWSSHRDGDSLTFKRGYFLDCVSEILTAEKSKTAGSARQGGDANNSGSGASPASGSVAVDLDLLEAFARASEGGDWHATEAMVSMLSEDRILSLIALARLNAKDSRTQALEEAADKLEAMNDPSGDAAAYDNRELTTYELEREHAISDCIETIRALARSNSPA